MRQVLIEAAILFFMHRTYDIHKAAGIIVRDRRLLVERSKGKDVFVAPGGKLEPGETSRQCLIRELREEFRLLLNDDDLEEFGTFYAEAAGSHNVGKMLRMDVFMVRTDAEIIPDSEVEEVLWLTSSISPDIAVGSIFAHDVLPRLKAWGLVD